MNCSFCIVPKTRGSERYRQMNEICDEIKSLRDRGVKEITLLGQIVNAYGRGVFPRVNGKSAFVQLLEKIHKIEGIEHIRFTSPHPTSFGKDLVEAFSTLPKLGDYAHLPMQSGSNKILKSMNRPYSRERFLTLVSSLRSSNANMRLSTDVIVGYPGETENNLMKRFLLLSKHRSKWLLFLNIVKGQALLRLKCQIKSLKKVKEERNQILLKILDQQSEISNNKLINKTMDILVESKCTEGWGRLNGSTRCYRKVIFSAGRDLIGQLLIQINHGFTYCAERFISVRIPLL